MKNHNKESHFHTVVRSYKAIEEKRNETAKENCYYY